MQRTELTKNKLTLPFPTEPSTAFYREIALCTLNSSEFHQKKKNKKHPRKACYKLYGIISKSFEIVGCCLATPLCDTS